VRGVVLSGLSFTERVWLGQRRVMAKECLAHKLLARSAFSAAGAIGPWLANEWCAVGVALAAGSLALGMHGTASWWPRPPWLQRPAGPCRIDTFWQTTSRTS
jgi:hypothetical protein